MNEFEKFLLTFLADAAPLATIFIHSANGLVILNASEGLLAGALSQASAKKV